MSKKVIGIDVGKKDLYLAHKYFTTTGKVKVKRKKFSNNLKGYKALIEWSKNIAKKEGSKSLHFIMEATGVYYEGIAYFLFEKGFAVSVINPSYIKSFANSSGVRTKTDQKDALVLVEYGEAMKPELWSPPAEEYRVLLNLCRAISSLKNRRDAVSNRIESLKSSRVIAQAVLEEEERLFNEINKSIKRLEKQIREHVNKYPSLKKETKLLMSINGVGWNTAVLMVAIMEGGRRFKSAKEAAAYLGLSVQEYTSGTSVKKRSRLSKKGAKDIRKALYFPAITAVRCNADVKALYERLLKRGKLKMVAIGAAMRKLVHICFGVLKNKTAFQPQTIG